MLVLVADDLEDTRDVLRLILEMKGHSVVEAVNGRDAVDAAIEHHPDLILMDVSMPILDGLEATSRIRHHDTTREIPIVACSSRMNEPAWRDKAIRCGCNYCCPKPMDFESLDTVLNLASQPG